jgi:lipoprotein-releasing system ATP-binding protein
MSYEAATAVIAASADAPVPIIEARGIRRTFRMGATDVPVLKGVDFALYAGELASISGSSGAGKSTLLHILGLLDKPDSGQLLYRGKDLARLGQEEAARTRNREFGFVFQFFHLLPEFTALENVLMPARLASGGFRWLAESKTAETRARKLLEDVGLAHRLDHLPSQLSGGERQRVAIARALINKPSVVYCDEPTGNLDSATAEEMFTLLRRVNREQGVTMLIVTHDDDVARRADRKLVLHDGRFISDSGRAADHARESATAVLRAETAGAEGAAAYAADTSSSGSSPEA